MFARVNIIFGKPDKVENGIAQLEEFDRLAVESTVGNRGLTTLVDRDAGVIVALSYWDEPAHSSEAALTRARESAVAAADGNLVVETYEVATRKSASALEPGSVVRLTRVQIESARIAEGLTFVRDEVLPPLQAGTGFRGAEVLIDRDSGTGLFLTGWTAESDAVNTDKIIGDLREVAATRVGATFPRTETYAVVRSSTRTTIT
ncbi:hypothetical protein [Pseudonocardia sp. GCM10023141]|uniref:hypothetical protein n=1 Tax=Pseudonocardia sp. GCM10023141 TaxID=3252653 RepID=UPI003607FFB7